MAAEHQEYINTKVNPTLENLVTQVLLERPDNPVEYMIKWLAEQTKASPALLDTGEANRLRSEIRELTAEVEVLKNRVQAQPLEPVEAPADDEPADDEDENDEDEAVEMAPPPASYMKKGRSSVSAEAYGAWNQMKQFEPPVHPKMEDQQARINAIISQSILFSSLDQAELKIVVGAMVERVVSGPERLIQEGEDGDHMYIIERGTFDCFKMIDGAEKVVKSCAVGDIFGELALLYNCPRAASVQAREDGGILWQLDRETFSHIVRGSSMKKRELYEDFLKSVPLLQDLGQYERAQLAEALRKEAYKAGDTVIREGDEGSRFFLVEEGELVVQKSNHTEGEDMMKYQRGGYFGELALLNSEVRKASVVAMTDARLLWVDRKTFNNLLGPLQDVMKDKAKDYVQ